MTDVVNLRQELTEARTRTDSLFALISPEGMYERPIPERHRLIFYLGHLEAFDWNHVCRWTLGLPAFHATFDQLFEAGIDPAEGNLPTDHLSDWPTIDEVQRYKARVRQEVDGVLDRAPGSTIQMAIEHRLMHAETNAYLLHHLDSKLKLKPSGAFILSDEPPAFEAMVDISAGTVSLGRHSDEGFGWDNEFGVHEVEVPTFAISRYKVTNQQYLQFVREGGEPPALWKWQGDVWVLRTMFQDVPLPLQWPVYVTHRQAQAYTEWKGMRLATEVEFHRAAYGTPFGEERAFPWGAASPNTDHGNFNFQAWNPSPVTTGSQGDSAFGVAQMLGNGWEWTSTLFHPFEGFSPLPTYPGYSARFFDQDHYVVKGAGPHTAGRLLRRSFRNWFRQGYPHAHTGFRCVKTD